MARKKYEGYDFSAWATRNNVMCSDGRTIMEGAFSDQDGKKVPIIWNHQHNSADAVLGHAYLENVPGKGVYMYGYLNKSPEGEHAKESLRHGDLECVSIYANKLKQNGGNVHHGIIREVSLVLAGANPGATIDCVMAHGDDMDEAMMYQMEFDEDDTIIEHADQELEVEEGEKPEKEKTKMGEGGEKTIQDVLDTLNEEQKQAVYALIGLMAEDGAKGGENMKHNVFDDDEDYIGGDVLCHAEIEEIIDDAKRYGSLKESFLAHAANGGYGVENLEYLFPDAKASSQYPEEIKREDEWVSDFKGSATHSPFSRVKTLIADITEEDARARGYIKGKRKKEMVFTLAKRKTDPQTIYVKSKLDRDDIDDVTDFDFAAYAKAKLDMMLEEEVARAGLVGDGRASSSDDHISHDHIRPIWTDDDLFTIKTLVTTPSGSSTADRVKATIDAIIRSRKKYKGSGNLRMYTTDDFVTEALLLKDEIGHDLFENVEKLAMKLRVKKIVTVPIMENLSREVNGATRNLVAILVDPKDYTYGADKGGKKNFFEDFDIDFNQEKSLLEARCSGALTKPFSAIAVEQIWVAGFSTEAEDPDSQLFGKNVSDLQEDVLIDDKAIEGTLKYVTGYTGFSGDVSEQSGNYLALKFNTAAGSTTTVELIGGKLGHPVTLDSDKNIVLRIENNSQKIKVVSTVEGEEPVTKIYSLRLVDLESKNN